MSTRKCWQDMKSRCANPSNRNWANYGGRGITVCERWLCYENFLADMGEKPDGFSIDRVDVNGNYEPGNCRWIPIEQQASNTRRTLYVMVEGKRRNLREVCVERGLNYRTVQSRINRLEISPEWALAKPRHSRSTGKGIFAREAR